VTDTVGDLTGAGVCTNPQCSASARAEPIELYPGPGQFCPECGELLSPLQAEPLEDEVAPVVKRRRLPPFAVGAIIAGVLIVALIATVILRVLPALTVRVCTTTMTDHVAGELIGAYTSAHSVGPYHYTLTQASDIACDVRFYAAINGPDATTIARDGVVAVVNPRNPISRLDVVQLHDILSGRIADWSQLGGPPGAIVAAVPGADTDEAHAVDSRIMLGTTIAPRIYRGLTAAQIVRAVASPSGVRSLGIVPFSEALPAKVIALGRAPVPSTLTIARGSYPLSVRIIAESDFRNPSQPAGELLDFARSGDAAKPINRAQLAPRNGY
jgi:PBP superfamily domain